MHKNNENEFLNERRTVRFDNPNMIHEMPLDLRIETENFSDIFQQLQSKDPQIILSGLASLNSLMNQFHNLDFMGNYLYQIINILNTLAEIKDSSNPCDKKLNKISQFSINILDQIFSTEKFINPNSKNKSFFDYYITSISDPNQMGICFSVINKMIDHNFSHKKSFYDSGYYGFIIQIPILQIPPEYLKSLTSIISICIQCDILKLPPEIPTKLLHQLIIILENYQNFSPDILDQCAQGCYNYVSIDNLNISLFLAYNNHIKLINAMACLSDIGCCYAISALGYCFCANSIEVIPSSLLNLFDNQQTEDGEINFDVDTKILHEIPLDIFKKGLELTNVLARADVARALSNVMFKAYLIVDQIFQSGLFESMMNHFTSDNFNIRISLLKVFIQIFNNVSSSVIHLFVTDQLFQVLEEMVESDDPSIEKMAVELLSLVESDKQHENIINEFEQFLFDRSLNE